MRSCRRFWRITFSLLRRLLSIKANDGPSPVEYDGPSHELSLQLTSIRLRQISTETLEISTTASTGHTPYLSPSAILLSLVVPTKSQPPPTVPYPVYTVSATYVHSSNGGKSLIKQEEVRIERCFGDFFDEQGKFWATGFEKFLGELEGKLMQS